VITHICALAIKLGFLFIINHILEGGIMAKQWAVLDAESDPFKFERFVKPFLWGFYDGETYRTFTTVQEAIDFLSVNEYLVYAHNGGKFDYHFMLQYVSNASPIFHNSQPVAFSMTGACPKIISSRLAEFQIGKSTFRDSYNILPVPLKQYAKDEISYDIFEKEERDKPENAKKIRKYLRMDCIYLYEIIKVFREGYGNGLTLAGSALKEWEKITHTQAPESTEGFYDRVAPWYMGGRVECFMSGLVKEDFKVYDINSAYPFAMLSKHPISVGYSVSKPAAGFERPRPTSLYRILAISDGAFPLRNETGSLWFPRKEDGEHEFYVTGWEYLAAIQTKTAKITKIIERLDFLKSIDFKVYVEHFYNMRLNAKKEMKKIKETLGENSDEYREWKAKDLIFKTFLNGLYGKFGANPKNYKQFVIIQAKYYKAFRQWRLNDRLRRWTEKKEDNPDTKEPCPTTSDFTFAGEWPDGTGERLLMMSETNHKRYYNVALAASITGYVRAMIWTAIANAHKRGAKVLYCDTDSIAVIGDIGNAISIGDQLGQWKDEGTYDHGAVCGKKLYAFHKKGATAKDIEEGKEWKMAHKGVRITHEDLLAIADGKTVTYKPMAPTGTLRGVNKGILDELRAGEVAEDGGTDGNGMQKLHAKRKHKKKGASKRLRKGSFVFTTRQVKMTV
jgi:hypothetical protein